MERPTINNTAAVFQAGDTVATYLSQAINEIDKRLGDGYARTHPELIAACVAAQTADFNNTAITAALWELKDALNEIAASIRHD